MVKKQELGNIMCSIVLLPVHVQIEVVLGIVDHVSTLTGAVCVFIRYSLVWS